MLLILRRFLLISGVVMLSACSPKYNWREVHDDKLQFSVLMPQRPTSFSRHIDLDGTTVDMTMTAADIDGLSFAVGTATLADAAQTAKALQSMRTALLNNIHGKLQTTPVIPPTTDRNTIDLVATGEANAHPLLLMARFVAKDKQIYQVLIMGNPSQLTTDNIETFFSSFKLN